MPGSEKWRTRLASGALLALCVLGSVACNGHRDERSAPTKTSSAPGVVKSRAKPQLTHRGQPQAPLEQFVQQHVEEADASGMRVLVYVGATWCEPCQRFHKALESGQLDEALAGTKFIEFDADKDR